MSLATTKPTSNVYKHTMSSFLVFPFTVILTIQLAMTLPVIAKYVLMIALYCPFPKARAPLKLGQNSQRNKVPISLRDRE